MHPMGCNVAMTGLIIARIKESSNPQNISNITMKLESYQNEHISHHHDHVNESESNQNEYFSNIKMTTDEESWFGRYNIK